MEVGEEEEEENLSWVKQPGDERADFTLLTFDRRLSESGGVSGNPCDSAADAQRPSVFPIQLWSSCTKDQFFSFP